MHGRRSTRIITQPKIEPLDLPLVKAWLREDGDDQDPVILALVRTAREEAENSTGRATIVTGYQDSLDNFPGVFPPGRSTMLDCIPVGPWLSPRGGSYALDLAIDLMRCPLLSVSSITYFDPSNNQQTVDPATYIVESTMEPGRVMPAPGCIWPMTADRAGAVQINYTAGYATRNDVPAAMVQAMRMLVSGWFANRDSIVDRQMFEVPFAVRALLDKVRVFA